MQRRILTMGPTSSMWLSLHFQGEQKILVRDCPISFYPPLDAHPTSPSPTPFAGVEHVGDEASDRELTISMTREASNQVLAVRSANVSWMIASATKSRRRAATSGTFPDALVQRGSRRSHAAAQMAATRKAEQCSWLPVL